MGTFALKLAKLNPNISPVVAIAGSNVDFVKSNGADVVLDYRSATIARDLHTALDGKKINHILDAANSVTSMAYLLPILDSNKGRYTCTTSVGSSISIKGQAKGEQQGLLETWKGCWEQIWVGSVHEDNPAGGKMFGAIVSKIIEMEMDSGKFKGHPYEVVDGGLNGVLDALNRLRDRRNGNKKYVVRIADTEGLV